MSVSGQIEKQETKDNQRVKKETESSTLTMVTLFHDSSVNIIFNWDWITIVNILNLTFIEFITMWRIFIKKKTISHSLFTVNLKVLKTSGVTGSSGHSSIFFSQNGFKRGNFKL